MQGLLAEALVRSGKVEQALELLPSIEALDPRNPSVPYVRSVAALKRGDSAEAGREATRALDSGRGAPAHIARALASFQDGELDAAETSLKRALESAPDDIDALYNLAVIEQRRNRYTPARTGYLRVLRIRPDHLDARANLALLALGAGAVEEARHHQRKLEELAPSGDPRAVKLAAALDKTKPKAAPLPIVRARE
jgi:tetratricopeptide (TPR) repeat protein